MSEEKPKIYGFNNGGPYGWMSALAVAEDGECVSGHTCSHEGFMPHDLGMDGKSDWHHDDYKKKYPDGYEVEFVPSEAIEKHEGLQRAFELNKARAKEEAQHAK